MAVIRALKKEYSFILKSDFIDGDRKKPKKNQTTWWHKLADLDLQGRSSDSIEFVGDPSGDTEKLQTKVKLDPRLQNDTIKQCLLRVENLKDTDGKPAEWPSSNQEQNGFLARMLPADRSELANAIRNGGEITEDEAKN